MKYFNLLIIIAIIGAAAFFILRGFRPEAQVEAVSYGSAVDAVPGVVTVIEESEVTIKSEVSGRILNSKLFLGAKVKGPTLQSTNEEANSSEQDPATSVLADTSPSASQGFDLSGNESTLNRLQEDLLDNSHDPQLLEKYLTILDETYINNQHDLTPIDYNQYKVDNSGSDLLVVIDPIDLELAYEAFEIGFNSFKEALALNFQIRDKIEQAKIDLRNNARRFREGNMPGLEWKRALTSYRLTAENEKLRFNTEALNLATRQNDKKRRIRELSKTKIYAPVSGTITEIFAWPGEQVSSGSPIATIISDSLLIQADINEEDFAGIKIGQKASIRFLSYGDEIFEGKINRILPTADEETQQFSVYIELTSGFDRIQSGLTGEVSIIKDKKDNTLRIPRRALLGEYVMVANGNIAELRKVEVGYRDLRFVEIRDGLEEGELVITEKLDLFKDGDKIRLAD